MRKTGRHGPQICFPQSSILEDQKGVSFSQNMEFLNILSLLSLLPYLYSMCPEENVGEHCLEKMYFQFWAVWEVFWHHGKILGSFVKIAFSQLREKSCCNFFSESDCQYLFLLLVDFFGGLRLIFFKHRCTSALYVSKNQGEETFSTHDLWFCFYCFLARTFWASAKSFRPSCQICILRVQKQNEQSFTRGKKHSIFSGSWAKFLERFGKDIPEWCQKWVLTVIENILSKNVFLIFVFLGGFWGFYNFQKDIWKKGIDF